MNQGLNYVKQRETLRKKFWEVVTKKIVPEIYKYWSPDAGEGNCVKSKREAWARKTEIRNLN